MDRQRLLRRGSAFARLIALRNAAERQAIPASDGPDLSCLWSVCTPATVSVSAGFRTSTQPYTLCIISGCSVNKVIG